MGFRGGGEKEDKRKRRRRNAIEQGRTNHRKKGLKARWGLKAKEAEGEMGANPAAKLYKKGELGAKRRAWH